MAGQGLFETILTRLESVATRLEASEARFSGGSGGGSAYHPSTTPPAGPAAASYTPAPPLQPAATAPQSGSANAAIVLDYDSMVLSPVSIFASSASSLGPDVGTATAVIEDAFTKERAVLVAVSRCKQPDPAALQSLVSPVGEAMMAGAALTEGRRSDAFNHYKVAAEGLQALSWVVYAGPASGLPPPPQHVDDAWQSAEFYANKILMQYRGKDDAQVDWVKNLKAAFVGLRDYVKKHHAAGVAWNAGGIPLSQLDAGASPAAAAQRPAGRGAPPPPPPPAGGPGSLAEMARNKAAAGGSGGASSGGGGAMAGVFAALNKGGAVTSGLRKVTDDMKAKNRTDRSGAVPAAAAASAETGPRGAAKSAGPAKIELEQGRKWVVENHVGNRSIVLDDTSVKQTVYIFGCRECTIQVKGKVNAITLDGCTKTGLVFDTLVAVCEVVNSASVEVQCTGAVPTVAIDKCDGCQLYLPASSLHTAITTAKSSEVNVITPGASPEDDFVEQPIPEQFVTTFKAGKWVTESVSHSGG